MTETLTAAEPIKKGRKYDDVIEGARVVFMRDGFEGANVDNIAREAGVSKATLYSYFPDKSHLFKAVLLIECKRHAGAVTDHLHEGMALRDILLRQCQFFTRFLLSDWAQEMFRVCVGEARRFPELGRSFYEAGPESMRGALIEFLQSPVVQAEMDIDDPEMAADQLKMLCHSDVFLKKMFGLVESANEDDINRVANAAVETFMARYARRGATVAEAAE
ncbi:MAG: TetR/AcrR family transcriptional regulator [Pseudomonadota bacterium]